MANARDRFWGRPPFQIFAGYLAEDKEFTADARAVIDLGDDESNQLAARLAQFKAFLGPNELEKITQEVLGANEKSAKVASAIDRLSRILHGADMSSRDALGALDAAFEKKADNFGPAQRRVLIQRLKEMAVDPVGFARQFKAGELTGALGAGLDAITLICDLRPIFDEKREHIEGAVPVTTLRLEYTSADEQPYVVEMQVSEIQLDIIERRVASAKKKLKSVHEMLHAHGLPEPSFTRPKSQIGEVADGE